jgi:hypothetical protein
MGYRLIDSDEHTEWCGRMNANGIGVIGNMYVFYAMINVVSFAALVWWARSQVSTTSSS